MDSICLQCIHSLPKEKVESHVVDTSQCIQPKILCNGNNNYNIEHFSKEKLEQTGQLPNVLDVVDEASAFDQISIPYTPDTDMDETNLTNPFEDEHTNSTNKNTNDMNDSTMHTQNPS